MNFVNKVKQQKIKNNAHNAAKARYFADNNETYILLPCINDTSKKCIKDMKSGITAVIPNRKEALINRAPEVL